MDFFNSIFELTDFPRIPRLRWVIPSDEMVPEERSDQMVLIYREQKPSFGSIEAARNPVQSERRDYGQQFREPVSFDREHVDDPIVERKRARREIMAGSYLNSSVIENELPAVVRFAWKGKINKLRLYLRMRRSNVNQHDGMGRTALHMAASWGDADMISFLLGVRGINIDAKDRDGKTALRKAVEVNSLPCVKLLIEHRADALLAAKDCRTPFEYALQYLGDEACEIIMYLFNEGSMSHQKTQSCGVFGYLHQLCVARDEVSVHRVAQELISSGVLVNATDGLGRTPLIVASLLGKVHLVSVFLRHNADVDHVDKLSRSAEDYANANSLFQRQDDN